MIDKKGTGNRINYYMRQKGMDVKELADMLIVTVQCVYKWLNGRNIPTVDNLLMMSKVFGCKMDDLVEELIDG